MTVKLEDLGFTKDELQQQVVDKICDRLLHSRNCNEDGDDVWLGDSDLKRKLDTEIKKRIDESVTKLGDAHVLPNIENIVKGVTLQATNQWGEAKGEKVSFIEYLIERAEKYMTERVNYEGKSKTEVRGSSWNGTQTRVTHLVHKYLHYSIETAMKEALKNANSSIVGGIEEAVKVKLAEVQKKLKITVATK